jgi:hypothetical protein
MKRISADFQNILEKYEKHKISTYKVLELVGDDYTFNDLGSDETNARYRALVDCGTQLQFVKTVESGKEVYHLKAANFCRQRCCPMCQFRKSEKMYAEVLRVVKHLQSEYRFLHLVLTIPNARDGSELLQGIKLLYKGFGNLLAYKEVRGVFKGVLRCLEVSYNYENDTFHPHLHCLVAVRPSYFNDSRRYLSFDFLRLKWSEAVRKAAASLPFNCEFMEGTPDLLQIHIGSIKEGDNSGVAEVCKYCVKPLEFSQEGGDRRDYQNRRIIMTMWHTLKGVRFVQKYGVIKEAFKAFGLESEDEPGEELEGPSMWVTWDFDSLKYRG